MIDKIHEALESYYPLFPQAVHNNYFYAIEDNEFHGALNGPEFWNARFVFLLLILAAEDELDGYPMEAVEAFGEDHEEI